jgi:hypothetical protein
MLASRATSGLSEFNRFRDPDAVHPTAKGFAYGDANGCCALLPLKG